MIPNRPKHLRGFLLVEAMIASVILAVAAIGIVSLLISAQEQQRALQQNSTAILLGKQLMEEIAAKPFGQSTPVVPRSQMTMANQYNGYRDSTAAIVTLSGTTLNPDEGTPYSRSVTIASAATPAGSTAALGDLQLVTVTVTTPSGQTVTLKRMLPNVIWGS